MNVVKLEEFRKSLQFVLKWEVRNKPNGGYTNDPADPGGETKYGISKKYHPGVDIKNLTPEQALVIYSDEYWLPAGCDSLPFPYNCVVFDSAVNPGLGFAKATLRTAVDVNDYLQQRKMYYYMKVREKPEKRKFLEGWLARVDDLRKFVEINQETAQPQETPKWGSLG